MAKRVDVSAERLKVEILAAFEATMVCASQSSVATRRPQGTRRIPVHPTIFLGGARNRVDIS